MLNILRRLFPAKPPDPQVRYLGELTKLTVGPNDMFILMADSNLSAEEKEIISEQWKSVRPDVKLVVLDRKMKFGVISFPPIADLVHGSWGGSL